MKEKIKKVWFESPKLRKVIGIILLILGAISVITPFTPFGFLAIIGLELLGLRAVAWEKLKGWLGKDEIK